MKKVLLTICLFVGLGVNAQSIDLDRIEADGYHQIMTKFKKFYFEDSQFQIGMKLYEKGEKKDWLLVVSSFEVIPDDCILLMKLGNDVTLTFPVNNIHVGTVNSGGYVYNIGSIGYVLPETPQEYYVSLYAITPAEMDKIEGYGISKIRFGTTTHFIEQSWSNNALGKHITKCRKSIQKRLDNPKIKRVESNNSIFDGF